MYANPTREQAQRYLECVKNRDGEELFYLITQEHPYVLWGSVTKTLSEEERQWVKEATEVAARASSSRR